MASYRPFPPPSAFPPPPPQRPNQYNQMAPPGAGSSSTFQIPNQQGFYHSAPPPPPPHQQYPYQPPPPPPPPDSSFQPPPPPPGPPQQPPPPPYYPTSQYSQYNQPPPPPPPPSSPPPPPSSPPPPPPKESGGEREHRERRDHGHSHQRDSARQKQHRPPAPPPVGKKVNGPNPGRVETEEERRLRKKREFEKQRQEEKRRAQLRESQNAVLQKAQMVSSSQKGGHGSIIGSRMEDRRATQILGGERVENRLKKPTTFLCKLKFRNELPDPTAQPKFMKLRRDEDRFTKYTITSLDKNYKPQLFVEPDLGIPLDLLDLSVYNPPKARVPLAPEDEELLRDDNEESVTPVKREGIRKKDRPTDKGMSWLVKTQYISPLSMESTKQSLTEKQAKELRDQKGGRNLLQNNRESQIKEIEASFEACKLTPVHATNKNLRPVEVLPLLPDFDRYDDKFVSVTFDGAPTADSEAYSKLDQIIRDACESRAVMKACVASGSDPSNPEKFLGYMVPNSDELEKDMFDESEDISYNWIREYNWDVRGDDAKDPTNFLVSFDGKAARYVPLPTKINLKKKRAAEGRSAEDVEHFAAPSKVTVRRRPTAAAREVRDVGGSSSGRGYVQRTRMGGSDDEGHGHSRMHRGVRDDDEFDQDQEDHLSGAEDDLSV